MAFVLAARYKLDAIQIANMLRGESGPVLRFMRQTTREVRNRAVLKSPVDTGHMRNSHREVVEVTRGSILAYVVVDADYAEYVHEGTRAHTIRPKKHGGVLVFQAGGETVFTTIVHHPGTKAQPWLLEAMQEVGRLRGFRVTRR